MNYQEKCVTSMCTEDELAEVPSYSNVGETPSQFIHRIGSIQSWGNSHFGDCVTAEEAFAKSCTDPEIKFSDNLVIDWAISHGFLDGANCIKVLETMQHHGFRIGDSMYDDGPFHKINFNNPLELANAISNGPIKLSVAGEQLHKRVPYYPQKNPRDAYIITGLAPTVRSSHDICLYGYGEIGWLFSQITNDEIPFPTTMDNWKNKWGYAMFTWDSVGIIDNDSMVNITHAAFLRTPTTIKRNPANLPNIDNISPNQGTTGDEVTIKGNWLGSCTISFDGQIATVCTQTSGEVTVKIPELPKWWNADKVLVLASTDCGDSLPVVFKYIK